jgi:hypothetical protein
MENSCGRFVAIFFVVYFRRHNNQHEKSYHLVEFIFQSLSGTFPGAAFREKAKNNKPICRTVEVSLPYILFRKPANPSQIKVQ